MESLKKQLAILNLTGELSQELADYFTSRNVLVVDPLKSSEKYDWTHIITKDIEDFDSINDGFDVTKEDRHIISLTKVPDLQNFSINNGNLVLDDIWFKGPMGAFIMDKYFQGHGGITLGDNYPAFKEMGAFNVANPFSTGEYLDRLVHKAFESGTEALNVKTYFDHLIMYITGLKNKGKAGLPFEVTYGSFEDIFAIQVHFFSDQLTLLDVSASLKSSISKKAEEYFLNVAVQSADFFDFSYMPDVKKVVVTGLWTKDERIKFENRGLMLASLGAGVPLARYEMDDSSQSSITIAGTPITDFSDKINIPDSISPEVSKNVPGSPAEGDESVTVSGSQEEDDFSTIVPGSTEETKDEPLLIKGGDLLEDVAITVKGKFEEDKKVVKLAGDKLDVEEVAFRIASNIDETTKEKNLKVRSLGQQLPNSIKTGLFDFAKGLNKPVEDLDDMDLDRFQLQRVPEIIRKELMASATNNAASKESKEMTVKSLGGNASLAAQGNQGVRELEIKLATANTENDKLRTQLKTLSSEVRILKESRNKLAEIQMKSSQASADVTIREDDDEALRKQFQQKLSQQKELNDLEVKKLANLLERETKLIADLKQEEIKGRKLQIEALQKDTFFSQELEKSERNIKAKDLIVIKTKETFTKLVDKKDREIGDLRIKMDQLTKALASGSSKNDQQMVKDLEKQNQNLIKQIDVYKNKISSMATNMQPSKTEDSLKDEARKLQMMNQQMKNQLDLTKKELEKVQMKSSLEGSQLASLRQDKMKLEQMLKKAQVTKQAEGPQQNLMNDQELKRLQAQNQILETQVKDSTFKITNLEAKVTELMKPQKAVAVGDEASKVKVTQLENSVKKLTQDLVEARNQLGEGKKETNKLRQEKTALQNQLDKLKKEADKAKPAAPKKPGGKAA